MPIFSNTQIVVTGEHGETIISGSVVTVSGSSFGGGHGIKVNSGETVISGSIITGSTMALLGSNPKIGVPFGDETITGSLPYSTTTGSLVMAGIPGQDGCWGLYVNMPTGSSPQTVLKWVLVDNSCS